MPTYPLAFPSIHPASVKATRLRVQSAAISPFTLKLQVFDWNASKWAITIVMQRMDSVDAQTFGRFMDDLAGMVGTFNFNLTPWVPGLAVPPGTKTFRLSNPNTVWDSEKAVVWGFQIEATEDI